ncbi:MAG: hypothetical protein HYY79_09175, partial [Betaproteobacteria bacterium]|nr:hypothetical protein [Betaproteobacteria bacterium]
GAAIPDGPFWTLHVPEALQRKYHLAPRYERMCFDRDLALRSRNSELGGIGHPLVDALLQVARDPGFTGDVAKLGSGSKIFARYLVQYEDESAKAQTRVMTFRGTADRLPEPVASINWLENGTRETESSGSAATQWYVEIKQVFGDALGQHLIEWQPDRTKRARVKTTLVGLHLG